MGRIVFIRQVVERQAFAEMSTAARDVGLVWSMIVQGIVTGALHILVKKHKGHHLYAIHAVKRIRKHVSITSSIILRKRRMQRRKRFVQSRVRE